MKGVKLWHYNGDPDIECGGFFYRVDTIDEGYADVVRVTPCSDAGGPDNCFWVERLVIIVDDHWLEALTGVGTTVQERRAHRVLHDKPSTRRVEDALACIGYDSPDMLADYDKRTVNEKRHIVIYALVSYGLYDQIESKLVQIGKVQAEYSKREGRFLPDVVLRSNASLRRYARSQCPT